MDDLNKLRAEFYAAYDAFEFRKTYDKYGPSEAAFEIWCAARRQPDAGVVLYVNQWDFDNQRMYEMFATRDKPTGPSVALYTSPPASPVPASARAAILEEAAELCDWLNGEKRLTPAGCAAAIRALAQKPIEVVSNQRGDSTEVKGRADAVDGPEPATCGACGGTGWVPRDPDIGTEQECVCCDGKGVIEDEIDRAIAAESAAQGGGK